MGERRRNWTVPEQIYASQVEALYGDAQSLYIGLFAAVLVAVIAAFRTGEPLVFACAGALLLTGCARAVNMKRFHRLHLDADSPRVIRHWEVRYVAGATLHVAFLGAFCFVSFWRTTDAFVQLLSFSTLLAVMIGVSGRNFSSRLLVDCNVVCAAVPMVAAVAMRGGIYWTLAVLVLIPFFLSLRKMAARLRGILFDAVVRAHDLSLLANRFDTALNNMPHGLAMFDDRQCLVVNNQRFLDVFRLGREPHLGESVQSLLATAETAGVLASEQMPQLGHAFQSRLRGRSAGTLLLHTEQRRAIECDFQSMEDGGSVLVAQDVTERKSAEARIQHLANYDPLTGLPNRAFVLEQLDSTLAVTRTGSKRHAILFVDLDGFKQVNDTLGHSMGDKLLRQVAGRIASLREPCDLSGRFGGDEFVLVHAVADRAEAELYAGRIIAALSDPYIIDRQQILVGTSIGISMAPDDGRQVDLLLKNADMALYRAKADGRGTCRFFEPEMKAQARALLDIEAELRKAVVNREFELHYQPMYDLAARRYSCCEALIRWRHPQRGLIPPLDFVPVAESTGLIVELGAWVLQEACRECARWPRHLSVAVNISPVQFRHGGLVDVVREALATAGLDPHRLHIEITESLLLQNMQSASIVLNQLREMGVCIALDDFGTGYSSLSYLHSLPLQKIKIDRSFVHGLESNDRSLVLLRGIARLSCELGLTVVVEGVETERQLEIITAETIVDEVQGYLFSRPVAAEAVRALLDDRVEADAM